MVDPFLCEAPVALFGCYGHKYLLHSYFECENYQTNALHNID